VSGSRWLGSGLLCCRVGPGGEFVGWSREQQYARLRHVANNQRFCVLPAGQLRRNLASAVLSRVLARLSGDYLAAYGHRVLAVETFTDPARHTGACYAAANFKPLGLTLGYSRWAGAYHHHGHPKRVWIYPLHRRAGSVLSATFPHPLLTGKDDHVAEVNTLELGGAGGGARSPAKAHRPAEQAGHPPPDRVHPDDGRCRDTQRRSQLPVSRGLCR
jgi:hypothetical protein